MFGHSLCCSCDCRSQAVRLYDVAVMKGWQRALEKPWDMGGGVGNTSPTQIFARAQISGAKWPVMVAGRAARAPFPPGPPGL